MSLLDSKAAIVAGGHLTNRQVINNLQVLRAIAALMVVVVHLNDRLKNTGVMSIFEGQGGVDIFFVISGFVMVYTTQYADTSALKFLMNRISRIVPIYWALTLAVFLIVHVAPSLLQATSPALDQFIKSMFFIPFKKSNGLVEPDLFVGWTLNYEMFFYVLFSFGLLLPQYKSGLFAIFSALLALVICGILFKPVDIVLAFYTQSLMLEFALGMLIALLMNKIPDKADKAAIKLSLLGLIVAGLATIVLLPKILPHVSHLFVCGLPAAAVVTSAVLLEKWGMGINNAMLLLLGTASYSIYLTHPFVTQFILKIGGSFGIDNLPTAFLIMVVFTCICALGVTVHFVLERPLSSLAKRCFTMLFSHRRLLVDRL